jgi:peptidoglycan hydrolase-like protein with peptidoglycan-binding domain
MTKSHLAAALLAFGSLAALPACTSPTYYRTSSAAPMPATQELSPGMVRQVQTALQQQNLYNGAIDGIWGPQTQSAVQSFQQSHGLNPTGRLTDQTLAALNLPTSNAAPAAQSSAAPPAGTLTSAGTIVPSTPPTMTPDNTTSSAAPDTTTTTSTTPPGTTANTTVKPTNLTP